MSRLCRAIETEKERGLREMERQRIKSVYVELVVVVGLIMTNSFKSRLSSHLRQVNLFASRMKEKRERERANILALSEPWRFISGQASLFSTQL